MAAGDNAIDACTKCMASARDLFAVGPVYSDLMVTLFSNFGPPMEMYMPQA